MGIEDRVKIVFRIRAKYQWRRLIRYRCWRSGVPYHAG